LQPYASPFAFITNEPAMAALRDGYDADFEHARAIKPHTESARLIVMLLPCTAWARRVSGVYANALANAAPSRATILGTLNADDTYTISLRAPRANPLHADEIAVAFGGGGRKAAAGIDALHAEKLDALVASVSATYAR
jgi:hypothetical protein